jgi:hypothetical protein
MRFMGWGSSWLRGAGAFLIHFEEESQGDRGGFAPRGLVVLVVADVVLVSPDVELMLPDVELVSAASAAA